VVHAGLLVQLRHYPTDSASPVPMSFSLHKIPFHVIQRTKAAQWAIVTSSGNILLTLVLCLKVAGPTHQVLVHKVIVDPLAADPVMHGLSINAS
jgi:ribosomal protein L25 (general stress protein Ctc)